jgi:hypothetical protein
MEAASANDQLINKNSNKQSFIRDKNIKIFKTSLNLVGKHSPLGKTS